MKTNEKNWWMEPSGQTQPQTNRPAMRVSATVIAARANEAKKTREAIVVANASSGSKWKKTSTGEAI